MPSVGWHLMAINRAHTRFWPFQTPSPQLVSNLSPSVAAASVLFQVPFPTAKPHGRPTGKRNTLSYSTTPGLTPLPLTSPLFSTPGSRNPSGSCPKRQVHLIGWDVARQGFACIKPPPPPGDWATFKLVSYKLCTHERAAVVDPAYSLFGSRV